MDLYLKLFEVLFPVFFIVGVGFYLGKKDPKINTKFITGELHNNNDYEFLSYLKSLGFNIRTNIKLNKPHFTFYAISDSLLNQLTRAEIRAFNKL